MRYIFLIALFVLPLWLFNSLVMPELASLENAYTHVDDYAAQAVGTSSTQR